MIARRQRAKAQIAALRHVKATPGSNTKKLREELDEKNSREWAKDVASKTDLPEHELMDLAREFNSIDLFKIRRLSELTQGLINLDPKNPAASSQTILSLAESLEPNRKLSMHARLTSAKYYATAHPDSPSTQRMVTCCRVIMDQEWLELEEEVSFCYKTLTVAHNKLPSCSMLRTTFMHTASPVSGFEAYFVLRILQKLLRTNLKPTDFKHVCRTFGSASRFMEVSHKACGLADLHVQDPSLAPDSWVIDEWNDLHPLERNDWFLVSLAAINYDLKKVRATGKDYSDACVVALKGAAIYQSNCANHEKTAGDSRKSRAHWNTARLLHFCAKHRVSLLKALKVGADMAGVACPGTCAAAEEVHLSTYPEPDWTAFQEVGSIEWLAEAHLPSLLENRTDARTARQQKELEAIAEQLGRVVKEGAKASGAGKARASSSCRDEVSWYNRHTLEAATKYQELGLRVCKAKCEFHQVRYLHRLEPPLWDAAKRKMIETYLADQAKATKRQVLSDFAKFTDDYRLYESQSSVRTKREEVERDIYRMHLTEYAILKAKRDLLKESTEQNASSKAQIADTERLLRSSRNKIQDMYNAIADKDEDRIAHFSTELEVTWDEFQDAQGAFKKSVDAFFAQQEAASKKRVSLLVACAIEKVTRALASERTEADRADKDEAEEAYKRSEKNLVSAVLNETHQSLPLAREETGIAAVRKLNEEAFKKRERIIATREREAAIREAEERPVRLAAERKARAEEQAKAEAQARADAQAAAKAKTEARRRDNAAQRAENARRTALEQQAAKERKERAALRAHQAAREREEKAAREAKAKRDQEELERAMREVEEEAAAAREAREKARAAAARAAVEEAEREAAARQARIEANAAREAEAAERARRRAEVAHETAKRTKRAEALLEVDRLEWMAMPKQAECLVDSMTRREFEARVLVNEAKSAFHRAKRVGTGDEYDQARNRMQEAQQQHEDARIALALANQELAKAISNHVRETAEAASPTPASPEPASPASPESPPPEDTSNECIICLDKPRTHFSNACAHMVLCGTCAATQTACPFCRTETTFRQLFVV